MVGQKNQNVFVWLTIDQLARKNKMTPSRLAALAGLDSSTFNKSKRFDNMGTYRLPSLNSVMAVCNALNITLTQFGMEMDEIIEGGIW